MTDEDLAKLLYETCDPAVLWSEDGDDQPATWDDLPEYDALDQGENFWLPPKQQFRDMARAVRAALTPAVAPLRPGETVNLPNDADHYARMLLAVDESGRLVVGITNYLDSDLDVPFAECYASLDAAGVDQLKAVIRRFEAAQGGTQR